MRYVRTLGLLAVLGAALMALAGSASATTLTSPTGVALAKGAKIKAHAEKPHTKLDGTVTVTCEVSNVEGEIEIAGGTNTTVEGPITSLTFEKCGNSTVEVKKLGRLIVHGIGNNEGTLTSTGTEVTVLVHTILGTVHCEYSTNATHIGTLTGSSHTSGGTATLDIGSAPIPQTVTDGGCKNDALWTGNYEVTLPDPLYIDA